MEAENLNTNEVFIDIVRNILFLSTKGLSGSESLSTVDMYTVLSSFKLI